MPGTTTRHLLPYPVGTDLAGNSVKTLAEAVDTKMSISTSGTMKVGRNLLMYNEAAFSLTGWIIIDTNINYGGNHMITLNIQGYLYQASNTVIDITMSMYLHDSYVQYATDVSSVGSAQISRVYTLRRPNGKLSIAMEPQTANFQWQCPYFTVDGMFGNVAVADADLLGWSASRKPTFTVGGTEYTHGALIYQQWKNISSLGYYNGWTDYEGAGGRTPQYTKDGRGWVALRGLIKGGTLNAIAFYLPDGYRPEQIAPNENHFVADGGTVFGAIYVRSDGAVTINAGTSAYFDLSPVSFLSSSKPYIP